MEITLRLKNYVVARAPEAVYFEKEVNELIWKGYVSAQALRTLPKYERIGHVDLNEEWKRILQGVLNDREGQGMDK